MTILLVDDDPVMVLAAAAGLERAGHRVLRAGTAAEALACLASLPVGDPDLLLLDARLEDTDGPELLQRLRAAGAAGVPAIFLTALTDAAALIELCEAGAVGVLIKPFDPLFLADDVERLLTRGGA